MKIKLEIFFKVENAFAVTDKECLYPLGFLT